MAGERVDAIAEVRAALGAADRFQFDKALAAARNLVEKQPENPQVHNLLGAARGVRRFPLLLDLPLAVQTANGIILDSARMAARTMSSTDAPSTP